VARLAAAAAALVFVGLVATTGVQAGADRDTGFLFRETATGSHSFIAATPAGWIQVAPGHVVYHIGAGPGGQEVRLSYDGSSLALPEPIVESLGGGGWRSVALRGLYPGVDLVFTMTAAGAKYEFRLDAGADLSAIRVAVAGARALRVAPTGELVVETRSATVRDTAPLSFQAGRSVDCQFSIVDPSVYGFACSNVDRRLPLVIDPLVYSTLVGGSDSDFAYPMVVDANGSAVLFGATYSTDFPTTPGAFDNSSNGDADLILAKLTPGGDALVFATYFGGASYENGIAIALDSAENIYVVGTTYSSDFPVTSGAYDTSFNGFYAYYGDAFVAKFRPNGSLAWCTYIGGSYDDAAFAVTVDAQGYVFVLGVTNSLNLPATNQVWDGSADGGWDTFVAKLSPNGKRLEYLSYLGGAGDDTPGKIAVDAQGQALVVGTTASADFPVSAAAYRSTLAGPQDAFAVKFNATGRDLVYSTFLGGQGNESATGLVLQRDGAAVVGGTTTSSNFPTTGGAMDRTVAAVDAFVLRLDANGSAVDFSTVFGGSGNEYATDLKTDAFGELYLAGYTSSDVDLPTTTSTDDASFNGGTYDAFLARLSTNGSRLLFATYLGGWGDDYAQSVAIVSSTVALVAGYSSSGNFPTTAGAHDTSFGGWWDSFLAAVKSAYVAHYETWPPGLNVTVDSQSFQTPIDIPCWVGSLRRISVATVQVLPETRNTFLRWNHSASQSHVLTCAADAGYVASFTTEVLLTLLSNASGALVRVDGFSYFPPYARWCLQGSNVTLNVTSPQVSNGTRFTFIGWSDGAAAAHQLRCAAPMVVWANFSAEFLLYLDSSPHGLEVVMDGSAQPAPVTAWCTAGSVHSVDARDPQEVAGTRFTFVAWSDGVQAAHSLVCDGAHNLTAQFTVSEHLIRIATDPPGLNVTLDGRPVRTPFDSWCTHGNAVSLDVPAGQVQAGTRFAFRSWSFDDSGAATQSIACDDPQSISASFTAEAFLVLLSTVSSGLQLQIGSALVDTPADYWCTIGSSFIVGAPSPQTVDATRYVFASWSNGRPLSHAVACAGPMTLVATFQTQFRVVLTTVPAGLEVKARDAPLLDGGTLWCDEGAEYALVGALVQRSGDTRFAFLSWADGANATRVEGCTRPREFQATFSAQYLVVVGSIPAGLTVRADYLTAAAPLSLWWDSGSLHEIEFRSPQALGPQNLTFASWSDGGLPLHALRVHGPLNVTATAASAGLPDFRLSIDSPQVQVPPGGAATATLTIEALNGYAGPPLTVTQAGLPGGIEVRCVPETVPAGGSCTIEVHAAPGAPAGDYAFTVRADNGTHVRVLEVNLHVLEPVGFSTDPGGQWALPLIALVALLAVAVVSFRIMRARVRSKIGAAKRPDAGGGSARPSDTAHAGAVQRPDESNAPREARPPPGGKHN
jgi:hypothetical protein